MNTSAVPQSSPRASATDTTRLQEAFDLCVRKTRGNIKRLADAPKSAAWAMDGNYFKFKEGFFEIGNWTSSFFTGMALIAWQQTEDEYFLRQVQRLALHYVEKVSTQRRNTHHDLGFLYSLFSVALCKLTCDKMQRETGLHAASVLANRFNATGGFIRAWGQMDTREHDNVAIIDSLMNLPLLYWASLESGEKKYFDIAVRHANTVEKNFVRPDSSLSHAYRFDLKTGEPIGPENFCGRAVDSYWARGAAWAIYGFALGYRYTQDKKYLEGSVRLAKKFISELDEEVVPVWDFRLPARAPRVRDASAAVIAVCGFQELARHSAADSGILEAKQKLLGRVCSDYLDFNDDCFGVLKSAYGDKPAYSSWGDYFLMEALARELFGFEGYW